MTPRLHVKHVLRSNPAAQRKMASQTLTRRPKPTNREESVKKSYRLTDSTFTWSQLKNPLHIAKR